MDNCVFCEHMSTIGQIWKTVCMLFLSAKTGKSGSKGIGWRSDSAIYLGKTSKTPAINPTCVVITNKDLHGGWMFTELVQTNRLTQAPSRVPNTSKLQEAKNSFADQKVIPLSASSWYQQLDRKPPCWPLQVNGYGQGQSILSLWHKLFSDRVTKFLGVFALFTRHEVLQIGCNHDTLTMYGMTSLGAWLLMWLRTLKRGKCSTSAMSSVKTCREA